MHLHTRYFSTLSLLSILAFTGCEGFDPDFRGQAGGFDTSDAARSVTEPRPEPDQNGLITYRSYQVVVAQRDDTVTSVAARIGMNPEELAQFNGLTPTDPLRTGEILALPYILPTNTTEERPDITAIASAAIDRVSGSSSFEDDNSFTPEPIRHQVMRGETTFSIARFYGVSPRALADWNGLGPDLSVREGQYLIIPLIVDSLPRDQPPPAPGQGSITPLPPSAANALPEPIETQTLPPSPNLDANRSQTTVQQLPQPPQGELVIVLRKPVDGEVLAPFSQRNDGIDYAAEAGSPVYAAADGLVATITRSTDQIPVLVLRHSDEILTVYANIDDLRVERGDTVSTGQTIAIVREAETPSLHFELRRGFEAIDPAPYIQE